MEIQICRVNGLLADRAKVCSQLLTVIFSPFLPRKLHGHNMPIHKDPVNLLIGILSCVFRTGAGLLQ